MVSFIGIFTTSNTSCEAIYLSQNLQFSLCVCLFIFFFFKKNLLCQIGKQTLVIMQNWGRCECTAFWEIIWGKILALCSDMQLIQSWPLEPQRWEMLTVVDEKEKYSTVDKTSTCKKKTEKEISESWYQNY